MGDKNRSGRQDKRKAVSMDPFEPRRQAPIRPVAGHPARQIDHRFDTASTSFSNQGSFAGPSSSFSAHSNSFAGPSSSFAHPSNSFGGPHHSSFAGPSNSFAGSSSSSAGPSNSFGGPHSSFSGPRTSFPSASDPFSSHSNAFSAAGNSFAGPSNSFSVHSNNPSLGPSNPFFGSGISSQQFYQGFDNPTFDVGPTPIFPASNFASPFAGAASFTSMSGAMADFNGSPDQQFDPMAETSMSTYNNGPSFSTASFSSASSMDAEDETNLGEPESLMDLDSADSATPNAQSQQTSTVDQKPTLFNLLLDHDDIMYQVCRWMPATDLVNFYAVSKQFHTMINHRITTLIVGNAKARMPDSAEVFHFKAYKSLCMFDAAQNMSRDKANTIRDVPTFRYLRFLEFREQTIKSILEQLALKGLRLPRAVSKVIKKIWFLMDLPDSRRRIGTVHNPRIWSDSDLFLACMFFMKFDMACSDPILGGMERRVRRLMLAQRTLSVMDGVLKREKMRNQYEMLQMFTEWGLNLGAAFHGLPRPFEVPKTIFGIPIREVGHLRGENWTQGQPYLMRPDEVIMKEAVRRELRFQDKLIDMMTWGAIHPVTREDVFPTNWKGEIQIVFEDEVEEQAERDIAIHVSKEGTQFDWDAEDNEADNEEDNEAE